MTTHGYGGFERFWLGSVADTLVRIAGVPLLLHRPHGGETVPFAGRTILVPLDGSPFAEQILPAASWLARALSAHVHLLRVVAPPPHPDDTPAPDSLGDSARADAERYLRQVSLGMAEQGCHVEAHGVEQAQPARAILDFAEQHRVDLIAMTTHGRGDVQRLLLGSVSDKVLRSAAVPLLLYRPQAD